MTRKIRNIDAITFEIISHRLYQISKEMGITLERVGGTVNTTQNKDYLTALYMPNGDILCVGATLSQHAVCAGAAVKIIIERFEKDGEIFPDDIFMINDPYLAAIHQSDVYVISPIHYHEQLMGWSATFVHVMDIGAMSPGGNSPEAREICQEGLRIPGIKLVDRGKLRKDVFNTLINMTRQPEMVGLDLKCEIAANNTAKSRMQALFEQYGTELIHTVFSEMIRYTEAIFKERIAEIPDGSWSDKGIIQADEIRKFCLTLHKKGEQLIFDFTGSDRQASRGINLPYHATFGSCYSEVVSALGYDIPKNQGAFKVMQVIAPEGTVVNVKSPGPVSLNTTSGMTVVCYLASSTLAQALAASETWKKEVLARNMGKRALRHAGVNQYQRYYVSTLSQVSGDGATSCKDGVNSGSSGITCPDVEWVELNFPVSFLFLRHIIDGAGAGKFRGGAGVEIAFTVHDAPEGKIKGIAHGVAGLNNSGQGIFGGYQGAPSIIVLLKDTNISKLMAGNRSPVNLTELGGKGQLLPYCEFELKEQDAIYYRAGSGGGYGDPLDREIGLVLGDVVNQIISKEAAEQVYGVVVNGNSNVVDMVKTQKLRASIIAERLKEMKLKSAKPDLIISTGDTKLPNGPGVTHTSHQPLRENLEIYTDSSGTWIKCVKCSHVLCRREDDWRKACGTRYLSPIAAGPLMKELAGKFLFEQLLCPSCGVLLNTSSIEESKI